MNRPFRIWFERSLPAEHSSLLEGRAVLLGAASDSNSDPFQSPNTAEGIIAAARIRYDKAFFERTPALRVICRTGMGYDNISLEDASACGVAVCNVPDGPSVSTAEHAVALILAVAKNLQPAQHLLKGGERGDFFSMFNGLELRGRVLGLVGLGRIGFSVAQAGLGLGMAVWAYDPFLDHARAQELDLQLCDSLEEVLKQADVLSLHVPLTDETHHLIDADRIRLMKPGALLINTARGGLVDEETLFEALQSGQLGGAGLDVFETEPPPVDHPLLNCSNVVATPHIAAATTAAKARLWEGAIRQVLDVLDGRRPPHLLNTDVWPVAPRCELAAAASATTPSQD